MVPFLFIAVLAILGFLGFTGSDGVIGPRHQAALARAVNSQLACKEF